MDTGDILSLSSTLSLESEDFGPTEAGVSTTPSKSVGREAVKPLLTFVSAKSMYIALAAYQEGGGRG